MKYLVSALLFITVDSLACLPQDSKAYRSCIDKANTQHAMNICVGEETQRVDAELNVVYRKLLSGAANQPDTIAKLTAAESAWVAYRDAYIEAMWPANDKQAAYGSIYPMEVNLLRTKLTQQQIGALKDLLKQYMRSHQENR